MRTHSAPRASMLEGSIWKGLISFALPILLGNLFQQLYNTCDTLIVGNFIGTEALAAVSSSSNLIFMLIGLLQGTAMGGGVLIAKSFGARDEKQLQLAVHTAFAFGLVGGLILTVAGVSLTPILLRWMGTPEEVLPNSIAYFRTYFCGALATFLYNIGASILQNTGDSRHPLYYLITASVTNVVLDLVFVAVLGYGVASVALATVLSQCLSATLCISRLIRSKGIYHLDVKKIRLHWPTFKQIVRFGLPSGVQNSVIGFGNVIVQKNINFFGATAMAGCGCFSKVEGFAFLPVTCFAMGLSTFVGQNLGAKQYDRVKKGARFAILCSTTMAEVIGVITFIFAPTFISLFNSDPDVIAYGTMHARTVSLFFCLLALSHCMAGIFRGAGRAIVPMVIMLGFWCVVRVTYISIMVPIFEHIRVVFTAYPLTWALSSIAFTIYFFKADWIHNFDRLEAQK